MTKQPPNLPDGTRQVRVLLLQTRASATDLIFDYLITQATYAYMGVSSCVVGALVRVPVKNKTRLGIVVEVDSQPVPYALKEVLELLCVLDAHLIDLARFMAHYYLAAPSVIWHTLLPALVRRGGYVPFLTATHSPVHLASYWCINDKTERALPKSLQDLKRAHLYRDLCAISTSKAVNACIEQGALLPTCAPRPVCRLGPAPTAEQDAAINALKEALDAQTHRAFLLDGVTGSGKTEVYLHALAHCLERGGRVLYLVPEIGLIPQTRARLIERFDVDMCEIHSAQSPKDAAIAFDLSARVSLVLGARMGILAPGRFDLIILDEAHDDAYKQDGGLCYHAQTLAFYRARIGKATLVLGSATPTLAQFKMTQEGALDRLILRTRARGVLPKFGLIHWDEGFYTDTQGNQHKHPLGTLAQQHIHHALAAHRQVLVFLNRRGYAPVFMCAGCQHIFDCTQCTNHLTLHKQTSKDLLICHRCNARYNLPVQCPKCHSENLIDVGVGCAKLGAALHATFANPQTRRQVVPILQVDKDTTATPKAWERLYQAVNADAPLILVGTQLLAKGHDFARIGLVVIKTDASFFTPRLAQRDKAAMLIHQVGGRAGRNSTNARVLIDTQHPQDPDLNLLIQQGYHAYAKATLNMRLAMELPPYQDPSNLIISGQIAHLVSQRAQALETHLCNLGHQVILLDEAPWMWRGLYFTKLLILSKTGAAKHKAMQDAKAFGAGECALVLDVDAQDY